MKNLIIVLISVDQFDNGRKIAERIEDESFKDYDSLLKTLRKTEGGDFGFSYVFNLSEFMDACNNQEIDLEAYWVSYVNLTDEK